jgi:hypothetical protein
VTDDAHRPPPEHEWQELIVLDQHGRPYLVLPVGAIRPVTVALASQGSG